MTTCTGRARLASAVAVTRRTIGSPPTSHSSLLSPPMRVERPAARTMQATAASSGRARLSAMALPRLTRLAPGPAAGSWCQMLRPEAQHSFPSLLGGGAVVDVALLIHKGMLRVVAVDVRDFAGGL